MIDISRPGHTYNGMDQQSTSHLCGRPLGQFFMGAVDGISCLKGNDIGLVKRLKNGTYLSRRLSKLYEIVMLGRLRTFSGPEI
jgi:hypothetical protein